MIYRNIPGTDLKLSQICLGTDGLAGRMPESEIYDLFDRYVELGGNFLDSALIYSYDAQEHSSEIEKIIGRWTRNRKNQNTVMIATKGAHYIPISGKEPRLSREEISRDLESSLKSLGVERIDLYWLHRDDPARPVDDIIESMNSFMKAGKINYFGCSNWKWERIARANEFAAENDLRGFIASQTCWSMAIINPDARIGNGMVYMDDDEFDFHMRSKLPEIPYSSQAKGFFTKYGDHGADGLQDKIRSRYLNETNIGIYKKLKSLSDMTGEPVSRLALLWMMVKEFIVIPIVGCKNTIQLEDSMKSAHLLSNDEIISAINDIA